MITSDILERETLAAELKGSLLFFTEFFYKIVTGREYIVSRPTSRESHQITICREFTRMFRNETPDNLQLNIQPGSGKSVSVCMFVAWCYAHYPDCNFLYISYSHDLAAKHTSFIKTIMTCEAYKHLFDVHIKSDSRAKDNFSTMANGTVRAFGSGGPVTGSDAGLPGLHRFSGAVLIDDVHKPDEVHSDSMRESVLRNYQETIRQRPRGVNVPIIFIGQRLHEIDLGGWLQTGEDTLKWKHIILKSLDGAGNALYPEVMPKESLLELQKKSPYVFASQYQQDPIPAGGALF